MTLDEMIKKEQENAQKSQHEMDVEQSQQDWNKAAEKQSSENKGATTSTIASSNDVNVNRDEFSLKTKKWTPTLVPEDFYTVKLVRIDKKEVKAWDSDEMVPNFIWNFEIIEDSNGKQFDKTVTISKWCKAYSKGENSNNYKYYEALMQKTPEDGYNILDCIGKYARAYVTQYESTNRQTGLKTKRSVIEKLLKLPNKQ